MKTLTDLVPKQLRHLGTFKKVVFCFAVIAVAVYAGAVVAYNPNNNQKTISTASVASNSKESSSTAENPNNKSTSTKNLGTSTSVASDGKNIDLGCAKTDTVPYKTTYNTYDSMAAGQKETIVAGQDGYTTVCKYQKPDGTIAVSNSWKTDPINAVVDEGTGKDQAVQEQQLEIEKQQRELNAENAGRYAQSTTYQNCVNIIGGSGGGDYSQCEAAGQSAYNNAYYNYLNSHPLP
jgi:hypothetical protein